MPRDGIAANEPKQSAAKKRVTKTMRLDGNEQPGASGNLLEQLRQPFILEVVQEQIGDDNFPGSLWPVENVGENNFSAPAEFGKRGERLGGNNFLAVEENCLPACCSESRLQPV